MTTRVVVVGNTLTYVEGSGQLWVHVNWVQSLRDLGCEVTWVELVDESNCPADLEAAFAGLSDRVEPFGLAGSLRLAASPSVPIRSEDLGGLLVTPEALSQVDLVINFCYWLPRSWLDAARRSILMDIDPGLLQVWMASGDIEVGPHDLYFSIGETVGTPEARFPDCGLRWHYSPPPVHLPSWPKQTEPPTAAKYTTVSHWWENGWVGVGDDWYRNDKRSSFLQFLDVPRRANIGIELAADLDEDDADLALLGAWGWDVIPSSCVTPTPADYRRFIQASRGEFSCAKPSCMRLQNAWVSDRSLCYLASGRPAVVQHTGPSRILPDAAGMFRFRTSAEAAAAIGKVEDDYGRHSREARALVEEHFDGARVARSLLERCL